MRTQSVEPGSPTPQSRETPRGPSRGSGLLLGLSWLVAVNTRSSSLSLAPLLPLITADLHLSGAGAGLLFGLPVTVMGIVAIPGGTLADRAGPARTVTLGLAIIALAGGARALALDFQQLMAATLLVGVGIGIVQPALPRIVRLTMAARAGLGTAIYGTGFTCGALLAAALTLPLLLPVLGSWRGVLVFWAVVAALSVAAWVAVARVPSRPAGAEPAHGSGGIEQPLRSPLLWLVALIFLLQTVIYYTLQAWLVPYYLTAGLPLGEASVPLAGLTVGSLAGGFLAPLLTDSLKARRPVLIVASAVALSGSIGLLLWPRLSPFGWGMLVGIGVAGVFVISMALPVDVAARQHVGAASGVVLAFGYGLAFLGPSGAGALYDLTGSYAATLIGIVAICILMLVSTLILPETHPARSRLARSPL